MQQQRPRNSRGRPALAVSPPPTNLLKSLISQLHFSWRFWSGLFAPSARRVGRPPLPRAPSSDTGQRSQRPAPANLSLSAEGRPSRRAGRWEGGRERRTPSPPWQETGLSSPALPKVQGAEGNESERTIPLKRRMLLRHVSLAPPGAKRGSNEKRGGGHVPRVFPASEKGIWR